MKKIVTFAAAFGIMASMGTAVFADADTTTTTETPASTVSGTSVTVADPVKLVDEPIIKADQTETLSNVPLILTENTMFYFEPGGKIANMLAPQVVYATGNRVTDILGNGEWVEIYTWIGTSWIHVGAM
ncbi:hypothetical protein GRF59_27420 [Paenibacillus sp. HJL G12]|uniref:SH3 domain-containing protein n=1 Tax=Paenibacillus dendrobii TaxID=2691084 RepID=A0A7X3LKJ9_9BACL|nr:hypothetical protein [Paenibacillus dendrobii]MWV47330.1 hypothetical protein [Paenibacillus dendrobii]